MGQCAQRNKRFNLFLESVASSWLRLSGVVIFHFSNWSPLFKTVLFSQLFFFSLALIASDCSMTISVAFLSSLNKMSLFVWDINLRCPLTSQSIMGISPGSLANGYYCLTPKVKVKWSHSVMPDSLPPPWTVAQQASPSIGFSRHE